MIEDNTEPGNTEVDDLVDESIEEGNSEHPIIAFAKLELALQYKDVEEVSAYSQSSDNAVLALLQVFADQKHSGLSAQFVLNRFVKLAKYEPLGLLTGADAEWFEFAEGEYQNKRNASVFKGKDGRAYYLHGRAFRRPDDIGFTRGKYSKIWLEFPCSAKTVYIDLPVEVENEDFEAVLAAVTGKTIEEFLAETIPAVMPVALMVTATGEVVPKNK